MFYYKFIALGLKICECQAFPTFYNVVLLLYGQILIRIRGKADHLIDGSVHRCITYNFSQGKFSTNAPFKFFFLGGGGGGGAGGFLGIEKDFLVF